jgi:hypothetical protein
LEQGTSFGGIWLKMSKRPATLGYPLGATPKLHLDKGDGTARCGAKGVAVKKREKLKDADFNWLCEHCSRLSLADAKIESAKIFG